VDLVSKRVLITGIDSFTGVHLSSYLQKRGYEVYGTSLFNKSEKIEICDITDREDIKQVLNAINPDYIIHLSAISFTAHGKSEDFYRVNTIGTLNILDTILELNMNPSKIILASSATIYGNQGVDILDESLCPSPTNHYGASKYAMECLAKNYFAQLNIIITRPFNYTGVGQGEHFLIPKIVNHFKEDKKVIELGNLDVSREFNDVGYLCEIYQNLLELDSSSHIVNLCSNRGIALLEVIEIMNEIAKYSIEVKVNSAYVRKDEIKRLTGSPKKLFELIATVEQKEFKETLRDMFET